MTQGQPENFKGIISCIPSFDSTTCLTKTIQFSLSSIIFITGLILLFNYIRRYGFKNKIYINLILIFMQVYLIINMCYCFWNTIFELYSIETYFNNLYFLTIVIYTTKSYLIKKTPKQRLNESRVSVISNDSKSEKDRGNYKKIKLNYFTTNHFYKLLYKFMAVIFFILFTMIFVTSIIGDIKMKNQGLQDDQDQNSDEFFSFLKDSCQELWYLCIKVICVILSLIVLVVLYKNYKFEQQRIKKMTLITTTIHERPAPFEIRSSSSYVPSLKPTLNSKLNNPLTKLSIWIGFNILGQIIDVIESGLLLNANLQDNCQIVPNYQDNSLLMLFFVAFSVYIQYIFSIWFFYESLQKKTNIYDDKSQKLLIQSHDYSEQIKVGHIEMHVSFGKSNSSGQD